MTPNESHCPAHIRESLNAYVLQGRETGGFLRAVLENDLQAAVMKADPLNLHMLPHIVAWVMYNVPSNAWGSKEAVVKHLRHPRGMVFCLGHQHWIPAGQNDCPEGSLSSAEE